MQLDMLRLLGQKGRQIHLGAINLAIDGAAVAQWRHVHRRGRNKCLTFLDALKELEALEVCSVGDKGQWAQCQSDGSHRGLGICVVKELACGGKMLVVTRRAQKIPGKPISWVFQSRRLSSCMGNSCNSRRDWSN